MKSVINIISYFFCFVCFFCQNIQGQKKLNKQNETIIQVSVSDTLHMIDPMIYGQMFEDCNDSVIYGGLVNGNGEENPAVRDLLRPLNMPIVRWPAGTYSLEYNWENGVGPKKERPIVSCICWGGNDSNLFGTDEFLQWCNSIGTVPYINFNMGNSPKYAGSLGDALNWLEYVNGPTSSPYGMKRALNGHNHPYNARYWCIGNENYLSAGVHVAETSQQYSNRLFHWSSTIKQLYPDLRLLGVGHLYNWNDSVLSKNGGLIDFLTLHYYVECKIKDNAIENPDYTLFSPAKVEANIKNNLIYLHKSNLLFERNNNPIRFSIDEWNNRHSVYDGIKYNFTRKDDRRQFDVVTVAGMLNVFVRLSPDVGMANYIFPVNGHGLVKTVSDYDAFKTSIYYVFDLYRQYMIGKKIDLNISGPTISLPYSKLKLAGSVNKDIEKQTGNFTYIDGAAVLNDNSINITVINRSYNMKQKIHLIVPEGYFAECLFKIESSDINASNTASNRNKIVPIKTILGTKNKVMDISLQPCGLALIHYCKIM